MDTPRRVRPVRRSHDQPAGGAVWRRSLQVFRRLDGSNCQRRVARRPSRRDRMASSATSSSRRGNGHPKKHYLHDLISSDRRNPTVNAYGPLFGSPEYSTDNMPIWTPRRTRSHSSNCPCVTPTCRDARAAVPRQRNADDAPSPYWGDEAIWDSRADNHNSMFDKEGACGSLRCARPGQSRLLQERIGSSFGKGIPIEKNGRQVAMLDPKTMKYTFIDTCFGTHHPQFGYDENNTLWFSGTGPVAGWISTKAFLTRPATPRSRKAGRHSCSIPTATASVMTTPNRANRQTPPRTRYHRRAQAPMR